MKGASDKLFSRTAFACNQHRHMALREAPDGSKELLHRRRLPDDFRNKRRDLLFGLRAVAARFFAGALNEAYRCCDIEGFRQVLVSTPLKSRHGTFQVSECGHDDDRKFRIFFFDATQEVRPRHAGHANIGHKHRGPLLVKSCEDGGGIFKETIIYPLAL